MNESTIKRFETQHGAVVVKDDCWSLAEIEYTPETAFPAGVVCEAKRFTGGFSPRVSTPCVDFREKLTHQGRTQGIRLSLQGRPGLKELVELRDRLKAEAIDDYRRAEDAKWAARIAPAAEEARKTGKPVAIDQCTEAVERRDSSIDVVVTWVRPDGSTYETRTQAH